MVKPESQAALTGIAALLKRAPTLQLIIVGHTDNDGRLEPNLDLSLRRAEAVAAALVAQFGVAAARLDARGVAFLSPVAPNTTEEGKARNRASSWCLVKGDTHESSLAPVSERRRRAVPGRQ